ncbi:hypothetical protein QFZ49_000772 [Streptomyces turgidiscabies]|uniref:Uncharacterized protein n=1 Tax=Streptomyces turgidiscabies TaxID=85558 RepID=A0ABU0RFY5_9ACTN|nr:hypothetical protein [Streptomyces turgidiscabies]
MPVSSRLTIPWTRDQIRRAAAATRGVMSGRTWERAHRRSYPSRVRSVLVVPDSVVLAESSGRTNLGKIILAP